MPDVTDAGPTIADQLAAVGRRFHARGWVLGTSGNFSAVVSHDPLRLAITASALDKGALEAAHILHVGEDGQVLSGTGRPSAETLLHVEIARRRGACAVLHTHTVWGTTLSDAHAADGFHVTTTGIRVSRNQVVIGVITKRADAEPYFRARYGDGVTTEVLATELTSPSCADLFGYRPAPDGSRRER